MTDRLPLSSMQLGFGLMTERTGRRVAVYELHRVQPSLLSAVDLESVLTAIMLWHPTLSCRVRLRRGQAYLERCPAAYAFTEVHEVDEEGVQQRLARTVEEFESDPDGPPLSAVLARCPDADYVLFVYDHALIDGQSLPLIRRQWDDPAHPEGDEWERFAEAVRVRARAETSATERGLEFWRERLGNLSGEPPKVTVPETTRDVRFTEVPGVAVPSGLHGSCFPYVLFSLHRAVRDVTDSGPAVVGYPWGMPSPVAGCFVNTAVSLDLTGSRDTSAALPDFLEGWYRELDHVETPFLALAALAPTFSGTVAGLLNYSVAPDRGARIAGVPSVEIAPEYGHSQTMAPFTAFADLQEGAVELQLLLDEDITGYSAEDLGSTWRHRLGEAFSSIPA